MHMTVERVSYLHESEIDELMNEIKHSLRPDEPNEALEVRRAVTLVRNGSVESYTYDSSSRTVVATINGVETVEVQLSFDDYEYSVYMRQFWLVFTSYRCCLPSLFTISFFN